MLYLSSRGKCFDKNIHDIKIKFYVLGNLPVSCTYLQIIFRLLVEVCSIIYTGTKMLLITTVLKVNFKYCRDLLRAITEVLECKLIVKSEK